MGMIDRRGISLLLALLVLWVAVPAEGAESTGSVQASPVTASGWYEQGNSYVNEGRYDGALYAYDMAIALDPDFAKAYFAKGQVMATIGRHSDAMTAYEKAIGLDPALAPVVASYIQASQSIVYPEIPSGSLIKGSWTSGWRYLTIDNRAGNYDLVVALAPMGIDATTAAVYVKKGYYHVSEGIVPPGGYDIYVTFGERWNVQEKRFDENAGYLKWALPQYFDGGFGNGYTMTFIPQTYYYPSWYVRNLDPVNESAFPKL